MVADSVDTAEAVDAAAGIDAAKGVTVDLHCTQDSTDSCS